MDLKALILKDEFDNDEIDDFIDYFKALMNSATNSSTKNKDNYIFYFNKFLLQELLRFRMML